MTGYWNEMETALAGPAVMMNVPRGRTQLPGDGVFDAMEALEARSGSARAWRDHPLDAPAVKRAFRGNRALYRAELARQAPNRRDMAVDHDFFDGIQWTAEEMAELEARGQVPMVYNMIATSVNWMLGTQKRGQMDYRILARRAEGQAAAESKTKLFAHVRDINHSPMSRSRAFAEAVIGGLGILETGQGDEEDGSLVYDRAESWRNIVWDSRAQRDDWQDARFIARVKWIDADVAVALWPDRRALIAESVTDVRTSDGGSETDDYSDAAMDSREDGPDTLLEAGLDDGEFSRPRLRVIEFWFKKVTQVDVMRGGQFTGELFDPRSIGHIADISRGLATVIKRPREVIYLMLMSEKGVLSYQPSPYRHNRYPFTPVWGYRRHGDGMPYGIVRAMRDINRAINKAASRRTYLLASTRVLVQDGAVDDIEELRDEAARPDAVIVYKADRTPPVIDQNTNLPAALNEIFRQDSSILQSISGVTDEAMGRTTNATSGKAIIARQDQGSLATSGFFDNLRYAEIVHGEKLLVNIEQFYDGPTQFRILGPDGEPEFVDVNTAPENAITEMKADFIISQDEWRASVRQAQAEALFNLLAQLAPVAPTAAIALLPEMIRMMDLPRGDRIRRIIQDVLGLDDPDEDPGNPSPEKLARQEAEAAAQQMQQRAAEAEVADKEARAAKQQADAHKAQAEARMRGEQTDREKINAIIAALNAAGLMAENPSIAVVADGILASAQSAGAAPEVAPPQPGPPMPAPETMPAPQPAF